MEEEHINGAIGDGQKGAGEKYKQPFCLSVSLRFFFSHTVLSIFSTEMGGGKDSLGSCEGERHKKKEESFFPPPP